MNLDIQKNTFEAFFVVADSSVDSDVVDTWFLMVQKADSLKFHSSYPQPTHHK